jgi:hypothetical protein
VLTDISPVGYQMTPPASLLDYSRFELEVTLGGCRK